MIMEFFKGMKIGKKKETAEQRSQNEVTEYASKIVDKEMAEQILENLDNQIQQLDSEIASESLDASMTQTPSYGDDMFHTGGSAFEQQATQSAIDAKRKILDELSKKRTAVFDRIHELNDSTNNN